MTEQHVQGWEDFSQLLVAWERLGPMERKLLRVVAMRVLAGQKQYGMLYAGKKDWRVEALEEDLDATVYRAMQYLEATEELPSPAQLNGFIKGR